MFNYNKTYEEADPEVKSLDVSVRYIRNLLAWNPKFTVSQLRHMAERKELGAIPGIGEKGVREIREALNLYLEPDLFKSIKEPKAEEYARRQAEALEKIEAAMVEILVELRKSRTVRLNADDLHALTRGEL